MTEKYGVDEEYPAAPDISTSFTGFLIPNAMKFDKLHRLELKLVIADPEGISAALKARELLGQVPPLLVHLQVHPDYVQRVAEDERKLKELLDG